MQIGYMINNNLILFIVFSFTIVKGFAFNLKKKGKCKLHVNLPVQRWDDLRFSNTTGILPKKLCGLLIVVEVEH